MIPRAEEIVKKVAIVYSLEEGYKRVRAELMEETRELRSTKRKLNKVAKMLQHKILFESGDIKEISALRKELQKVQKDIDLVNQEYQKISEPYRVRMMGLRERVKILHSTIKSDLIKSGYEIRPITNLEEADRLLQAFLGGGGTGKA